MSTNRTFVSFVAAEPVTGTESADFGLDLALLSLEPVELPHPIRQAPQVTDDQRAHRGVAFRGGDPGVAVDVIWNRDGNILH